MTCDFGRGGFGGIAEQVAKNLGELAGKAVDRQGRRALIEQGERPAGGQFAIQGDHVPQKSTQIHRYGILGIAMKGERLLGDAGDPGKFVIGPLSGNCWISGNRVGNDWAR